MQNKESYWRTYFDETIVEQAEAIRSSHTLTSRHVRIHVDAYEQAASAAPIFIFNHGGGVYSRLFTALAVELFALGYTVLLPDQVAHGLSGGTPQQLTVETMIQNVVDATAWARERYAGPIILSGASLGSAVVAHAVAAGAPADLIVCHNLYQFGRVDNVVAFSRTPWAANLPLLPSVMPKVTAFLANQLPDLSLPYRLMGYFDRMVDERDAGFYEKWLADPVPMERVTLAYVNSMLSSKIAVPLAENERPFLVINPTRDKMVSPELTRRNYERLGGPKAYLELPYGHWSVSEAFLEEWTTAVHDWIQQQTSELNLN